MPSPHRRSSFLFLVIAALSLASPAPASASPAPFQWVEATISQAQAAFADGTLTCVELVQGYLDRIAAYDRQGPTLQSIIAVDAAGALAKAAQLDAAYRAGGGPVGPLHCVPLLLKDNIDTADLPTTGGALALAGARPPDDAFVVARLRRAGAVILGKTNLDEFAFGFGGSSSMGGQVHNPYDPQRGPGGSSSGTGAAVAASFAMAGLGTDTGGSIRVPSSAQGLVGIRPSLRLTSIDGILPLAHFQDTSGPMCRVVADCARLLTAMVGFDPSPGSGQNTVALRRDDEATLMASPSQYQAITGVGGTTDYVRSVDAEGLRGARVGVVRALFGSDADVAAAMTAAIGRMTSAGATVVDVEVPDLSSITSYSSVSMYEFRDHLTEYLQSWPSTVDGHKRSFEEVAASLGYESSRTANFASYGAAGASRYANPQYDTNTKERRDFVVPRLLAALDNKAMDGTSLGAPFDALLYPSVLSVPQVNGPPSTGSNNRLSPFSGFPALTLPAAFTAPTAQRVALPIGMELLGREFAEPTLIRLAAGYEATAAVRTAPTFTPELPRVLAASAGAVPLAPPSQATELPAAPIPTGTLPATGGSPALPLALTLALTAVLLRRLTRSNLVAPTCSRSSGDRASVS
jgi:amidase